MSSISEYLFCVLASPAASGFRVDVFCLHVCLLSYLDAAVVANFLIIVKEEKDRQAAILDQIH